MILTINLGGGDIDKMFHSFDKTTDFVLEEDMALGYANGYGKNRLGRRSANNPFIVLLGILVFCGVVYYLICNI